jgi:phosphoglycolate phosphatase
MALRHIIWDWNGTLLDDVDACVAAINVLLARRGLPRVDRARYTEVFAFPVIDYYRRLGFDFEREDWHALATEYHVVYDHESAAAPLRPGTADLLAALRARGIDLSVLSACEQARLDAMMAARGVRDSFRKVCGRADVYAHSKLTLGRELLNGGRWKAAESLLVGDTTHDHEVALALGVPCLLMTGGHQSRARLEACGCPLAPDMRGVARFVEEEDHAAIPP